MFFKQYNYKPRSNSQSSQGSGSGGGAQLAGSPPKDTNANANTAGGAVTAGIAGRTTGKFHFHDRIPKLTHRAVECCVCFEADHEVYSQSSAAGADKFAGLNAMKRNSQDGAAGDRKASWAEQKPGSSGVLSGMWNNFTKGS